MKSNLSLFDQRVFQICGRSRRGGPVLLSLLLMVTSALCFTPPTKQSELSFEKGVQLYNEARFSESAEAFKHVVQRDQTNAEAFYYLGNSYFRMLRYKDAIKAYQRTIELKPDHLLAYNNLGTAYHSLRDFKSARETYEKALQINPNYADAVFGLGIVFLELKDKAGALEQHKKLSETDSERADKLFSYINDKKISLPVLNGKALNLPMPAYPAIARGAHASGAVIVWVSIDEEGKVISASVLTGHPLLRSAALDAARLARFSSTLENGKPTKVTGIIKYDFLAQ